MRAGRGGVAQSAAAQARQRGAAAARAHTHRVVLPLRCVRNTDDSVRFIDSSAACSEGAQRRGPRAAWRGERAEGRRGRARGVARYACSALARAKRDRGGASAHSGPGASPPTTHRELPTVHAAVRHFNGNGMPFCFAEQEERHTQSGNFGGHGGRAGAVAAPKNCRAQMCHAKAQSSRRRRAARALFRNTPAQRKFSSSCHACE